MTAGMFWPTGREDLEASEAAIDDHAASCPACRTGRQCPSLDDLYEAEFRTYGAWWESDRTAARQYRDTQADQWKGPDL